MKPSRRGSSSDLERARASAERLSREGEPVAPPESLGYIRFSARPLEPGASPVAKPRPSPPPSPPSSDAEITIETQDEADKPATAAAEEMIQQLVTEVEEEQEPPPPWAQVLEDCVAVSQARAGLIVDPRGRILAASDQLPKAKLEAIAGRLQQALQEVAANPSSPESMRSASVQLGAFWLTGLRVPVGAEHVSVGLLASAALEAHVLPVVETEARRGAL